MYSIQERSMCYKLGPILGYNIAIISLSVFVCAHACMHSSYMSIDFCNLHLTYQNELDRRPKMSF